MDTRLWWVNPATVALGPAARALLSEDERARHQRYLLPRKQHEYLVTRVLVRTLLGRALGVAPQTLQFTRNAWGRPELQSPAPLHFNVSHTEGLVVCLLSPHPEIGVDTEQLSRGSDLLALAPTVFAAPELRDLAALPASEQARRAVQLWTLKESYLKARGTGLALPLDGFAFRFDPDRMCLEVAPALQDDGARWQFQTHWLGAHCISTSLAGCGPQARGEESAWLAQFPIELERFSLP
ncbi:MAG: 4'-phosphopantetheinyl transferase superfamily protein [Xanthomonadales bacterium]|jgi:4'-phosphopantetheinyl transferase|nr:4'-phosphopantetheinyl transferase superfamily protein [Xanthomonadales bacterium]